MASSTKAHRAVAAGLSGGLGIALPLAAYAATMPLPEVNNVIRLNVLPLAAGALAGVGLFAVSEALLDRRSERRAAEEAEVASFTSVFQGAEAASPYAGRSGAGAASAGDRASASAAVDPDATRSFRAARERRASTPKGVPVITRAVDALDEAEAWAEIDAMLRDDSPISCDPARSKDMYEIALEELRRVEQTYAGIAAQTAAAAPRANTAASASRAGYSAEVTAVTSAVAPAAAPAVSATPAGVAPAASAPAAELDEEELSARNAAIASLYGSAYAAATAMASLKSTPATPAASAVASSAASAPAQQPAAPQQPAEVEVPMADYRGHEDMWASALAILEEEDAPVASASSEPEPYRAAHFAPAPQAVTTTPTQTAYVSPNRMAAVAEGGNATREHARVNAILKEEFDKVPSSSVRRTSREYLRVIQGGTASMPRLQAQA